MSENRRMDREKVKKLLGKFKNLKIAVIGDLILDKYIFGKVERISPEAPVPIFEIEKEEYRAGGAANVALNLADLGVGKVALFGTVGEDSEAEILENLVSRKGILTFFEKTKKPTVRKTRLIARSQQILRIDREDRNPIGDKVAEKLVEFLKDFSPHAVIVSDYAKGVITEKLTELLRDLEIPTFVDPRPKNASLYRGFTTVTPNLKEFHEIAKNLKLEGDFEILTQKVKRKLKLETLIVTLSEKGIALVKGRKVKYFPATAKEVYDVTGAGDTVIATLTATKTAGGSWETACKLANIAAGIVVGKLGTATVKKEEILEKL
jgi:rfaE bifunctional protein kinase chain/domain